jgi:hypothetical protein
MAAFHHKAQDPDSEVAGPATTAAAVDEGSLGEAFRRDLQNARHTLARFMPRSRRARRITRSRAVTGTVPSSDLVARLSAGLKKEHDLVLWPLLDRLDAFASRLTRGENLPPEPIEEGLALIDRYLHELHDVTLGLLEIADVDPRGGAAAALTLAQLGSDYEQSRVRWATVRVMLRGHAQNVPGYRALLGITLTQECRAERAWHDFEEKYVRTSVPSAFPPKVAETWQAELDRGRIAGRADRVRVEEFLAKTAPFLAGPG